MAALVYLSNRQNDRYTEQNKNVLIHINDFFKNIVQHIALLILLGYSVQAIHSVHGLAVWLSGNALASINVVALRQTRLVPGWVTVCGRVNHLGL